MLASLIVAAAAAAQSVMTTQVLTPPPVVALQPPTIPPLAVARSGTRMSSDSVSFGATAVSAVPVRVRVMVGNRELFNDTLRVNRNASASYQESRSEAPEMVCSSDRHYGSQERYSLSISLSLRDDTPSGQTVNLNVSWQRPNRIMACGGEGSRQVQLTQTVPLGPGQSTTVQGDAGLNVTVSR
jgi:hypothetical protein